MKKIIMLCLLMTALGLSQTFYQSTNRGTEIDSSVDGNFGSKSITISQSGVSCNGNSSINRGISSSQTAAILQTGGASGVDEEIDNTYEAFKFTASFSGQIGVVAVNIKKIGTITNTAGYLTAWIYTDNAGVPGTKLQSAVFTYARYGNLTTNFAEYAFLTGISTPVSGTSYWIVLQRSAAPTGGTVYINRGSTGTAYYAYSSDGTSWTPENNKNPSFTIYATQSSAVYGYSQTYAGLYGVSHDYHGIVASSVNDFGGLITSTNSIGLVAASNYSTGILGSSTDGIGTQGVSTSNYGVNGQSTSGYGGYFSSNTGYGVGASSPSQSSFYGTRQSSTTNTVVDVMTLRRLTTGTAANGIGGSIDFVTGNAAGSSGISGRIVSKWVDATTMDAVFSLQNRHLDGALYDDLYIDNAGTTFVKNLYPQTDNIYYLGKNDATAPLAYKGLILKDTTNGFYYRIEIINGVVTATQI